MWDLLTRRTTSLQFLLLRPGLSRTCAGSSLTFDASRLGCLSKVRFYYPTCYLYMHLRGRVYSRTVNIGLLHFWSFPTLPEPLRCGCWLVACKHSRWSQAMSWTLCT